MYGRCSSSDVVAMNDQECATYLVALLKGGGLALRDRQQRVDIVQIDDAPLRAPSRRLRRIPHRRRPFWVTLPVCRRRRQVHRRRVLPPWHRRRHAVAAARLRRLLLPLMRR